MKWRTCGEAGRKSSAIYRESEILRSLRDPDRIGNGCRKCFFMHLCRGGLRCLSYALTGSPFETDPGCRLSDPAVGAGSM